MKGFYFLFLGVCHCHQTVVRVRLRNFFQNLKYFVTVIKGMINMLFSLSSKDESGLWSIILPNLKGTLHNLSFSFFG